MYILEIDGLCFVWSYGSVVVHVAIYTFHTCYFFKIEGNMWRTMLPQTNKQPTKKMVIEFQERVAKRIFYDITEESLCKKLMQIDLPA